MKRGITVIAAFIAGAGCGLVFASWLVNKELDDAMSKKDYPH